MHVHPPLVKCYIHLPFFPVPSLIFFLTFTSKLFCLATMTEVYPSTSVSQLEQHPETHSAFSINPSFWSDVLISIGRRGRWRI
uniref:Uncharacterized protein n=1 Tax=Pyxicephalus adspersus TaxID=30357 RepID=A0AAV3ARC3_PYXAD|nr:TPA: hypothetical protein GDO54_008050 [Pyxicephalus adspersus]